MRLLGYVNVGLHSFCVFEKENVQLQGEDQDGLCDPASHMISIKAGLPVTRQQEVLMHELIHLAYYHNQMALEKRHNEETVCTRVAPSLAEILNRNPWISKFIEGR